LNHIGEIAALLTAACFAGSAISFSTAGERVGSLPVNIIRLVMGLAMLMALTAVTRGRPLPLDADAHAWAWLSLSGVVGFAMGDLCLFRALVEIGPRLSALLMSLAPPAAAFFGWLLLGEKLDWLDLGGVTLTFGGIAWAISARTPTSSGAARPRPSVRGVLLGLGGAMGQALGLVLSKIGMGSYDAFAATEIRAIAGLVSFALLFSVLGIWPRVWAALRDTRTMAITAAGSFFGPFLGVGLSLLAVQNTDTGVAASLMATTPILIIPFSVIFRGERVGLGAVGGAIVAVVGVVLLFM
jgi:drug/metabolite transporter (DMT)-like permease